MQPKPPKTAMQLTDKRSAAVIVDDGLYVPDILAEKISDGACTVYIDTKRRKVTDKRFVLCGTDHAYGTITVMGKPVKHNTSDFESRFDTHSVTSNERKQLWPTARSFFTYDIEFDPFDTVANIITGRRGDSNIDRVEYVLDNASIHTIDSLENTIFPATVYIIAK